jgi:Tol biopolymer transport system component
MRISSKLALALLVVAALAFPAAAGATLSYVKYTKNLKQPTVFYAKDNGSSPHKIGPGLNPKVSPDGESVIYERSSAGGVEMRLFSVAAGKSERLLNPWQEGYLAAWSPDSSEVAALTGPLNGPFSLDVIDVKSGHKKTIAKGWFNGFSFSPNGEEVVYGVAGAETALIKSNVFKVKVDGTKRTALSRDHASGYPLWSPGGQIFFARFLGAKQRQYGPKTEIFSMTAGGRRISQVTKFPVNQLSLGLVPLAVSKSGARLLAEFNGQDQSYGVAISTITGAERKLTKNPESGFSAAALSPDGDTVLGTTGYGFDDPHPKVVTVPWGGGPQKVLAPGGFTPSWGG